MCGICGLIVPEARPENETTDRMIEEIRHRGSNDYGWVLENRGALAMGIRRDVELLPSRVRFEHRRLSIQNLSANGVQPMVSADGNLVITYDGEIYNFLELRAELTEMGHHCHKGMDTKVLLAAFAQ